MPVEEWKVRQEFRRALTWASIRSLSDDQKRLLAEAERYIVVGEYKLADIELRSLRETGADWSDPRL